MLPGVNEAPLAGLVRVSHVGGREGDRFHAADDQVAEIERYSSAQGVGLRVLPPELDVSGGLPIEDRPSLLAAVEGVERGDFSGIIVSYLSRLGRNVREQLRCWDRVEAAGGKVIVVREGIDTTTAAGRLHRNLLLSIAEHEREVHAEQFARRRAASCEAGIWRLRQVPLGYDRDPDTRRLVPNEEAAARVRRAFTDRARQRPISEIARELAMTPSGVRYLLRNRVYLGELRDGRTINRAAHPPILTTAEFEAAQIDVPRPPRSTRGRSLLAGIVRCASCGHIMTRGTTKPTSTSDGSAYVCPGNHSGESCPQPAAIACSRIDPHVEAIALQELAKLALSISVDSQDAEAEVRTAALELESYLNAVSAAVVGEDAFTAGAEKRKRDLEAAQRRYRADMARSVPSSLTGTGATVWPDLDAVQRNQLLRSLLSAVVVTPAGRGRRVPVDERATVVRFGAAIRVPRGSGGFGGAGIVPLEVDDIDPMDILRVAVVEDPL